jgi:hypothetical protein
MPRARPRREHGESGEQMTRSESLVIRAADPMKEDHAYDGQDFARHTINFLISGRHLGQRISYA